MRLLLKIVMFLVIAVVLVAAILLVPPHLQVRGVEPALPDEGQLRALLSVEDGPVGVRFVNTSTQTMPEGKLGHAVFLIEWANGNLFMIDAGMDRTTAVEFGKLMESALGAEPAVSHGTIEQLIGNDVQRVNGVAFTHLHIDHTQGVVAFCEARGEGAAVYQTHWQQELQNFNTEDGAEIIADSCLAAGELNGEGLMTLEEYPGLGIAGLGGHTPGSTLFAIAGKDLLWLLSGDTTNTKADIANNTGKGFLYSYLLVPENTRRTEELRVWLNTLDDNDDMTVVVSHDLADIESSGMRQYGR